MKVVAAERVASVAGCERLPAAGLPELAFLGRSNVGKSSLLNRLAGRRRLARTSATPGKTRLLHFYRLRRQDGRGARELLLVDLPGYGWARVSRAERGRWRSLVEGYLSARAPLCAAVLLQDARRDASADELDLIAWLEERGIPVVVALTKCDKLKPAQRVERLRAQVAAFGLGADRVIATSAETGLGIDVLWRALEAHLP